MIATRVKCFALVLIFLVTGCASATYKITEYEEDSAKVVTEISYNVLGKRELNKLDVNVKTGKIKLGSAKGDAGDLGTAIMNATEFGLEAIKRVPNIP